MTTLQQKDPEPSGIEGWNDVCIIEALYQSIETGQPVQVNNFDRDQRPTSAQTIELPATEQKPELIHATPVGGKA